MANLLVQGLTSTLVEIPPDATTGAEAPQVHIRFGGSQGASHKPAIVFVAGLGSSCLSFSTAQRQLSELGYYTLSYDRLGTGRSSSLATYTDLQDSSKKSPHPRPATELAVELHQVLLAANVTPPYVLAAHSYGGVIICEYLASHPDRVAGLVFIDANSDRSPERPVGDADLGPLLSGIEGMFDYYEVVDLNASNTLHPAEWEELKGAQPPNGWKKGENGGRAEAQSYNDSCRALAVHQQKARRELGTRPVSVIQGNTERDFRLIIDEAERLGGGTPQLRESLRNRLDGYNLLEEEIQGEQLCLTADGKGRMVKTARSGHYIQLIEPELVVKEVEWVSGSL